jgi:DnaK suppressor protein
VASPVSAKQTEKGADRAANHKGAPSAKGASVSKVESPKHAAPLPLVEISNSTPPPGPMNPDQVAHFKKMLEEKRMEIIKKAQQTLDEDMTIDVADLPDDMDLASSEYLQSFTFRLRGREKTFLDKIDKALERIREGHFGECEDCGEEISLKRLEARPETTLCIRCKEDQERAEKDFA